MGGTFTRRPAGGERGQATVELALSSVVLVLLLLGLLDLARVFYFAVRLQDAAREGARIGSLYDPQQNVWPNQKDSVIATAVNDVMTNSGMPSASLQNPSTTCPATKDGNANYNPPYVDSAFPSAASEANLYICWDNHAGTEPPVAATHALNVIILYRFGLFSGFLQSEFGPSGLEVVGQYQATVQ